MKRNTFFVCYITFLLALLIVPSSYAGNKATKHKPAKIECDMNFSLKSWSVFYKRAKGRGSISCDNGERFKVKISAHGGGLTFGKSKIANGHGSFSDVESTSELFGSYATSEAHAGAKKSAGAQAMTKGKVSLAISGTGEGWDLGIAFGGFKITKVKR